MDNGQFTTLPRTIEEATRRYLYNYERNFIGEAKEMVRLKNTAEAFILRLRQKAPIFYEQKLPKLINQAASSLLTFDTSSRQGVDEFHLTHRYFLTMLKDLQESQPAGEVNFSDERRRAEEKDKLIAKQVALIKKIEELEATEFDYDELGEEEADCLYNQTVTNLESLRNELRRVSIEVAFIEGEKIDEEPHFELKFPPASILNRLTKEQIEKLEGLMLKFYTENNQKKNALYVDKSIIDGMVEQLNIDMTLFKKEELKDITKDALDAYKSYYREIEHERREEFHSDLLKNKKLLPKEGIIFASPDDIPEEAKRELESNSKRFKSEVENIFEEYSNKPYTEELGDMLDDSGGEDDDEPSRIMDTIKQKGIHLARVKEEPRNDLEMDGDLTSGDDGASPIM